MTKQKPSKSYFGKFRRRLVIDVHRLLAWGYQDAYAQINSSVDAKNREEPAITGFIAEAIEDRINDINRPRWCKNYSVYDDPFERHSGKSGRSRLRSDLAIKSNEVGGPRFIFEAKRLERNSHSGVYTSAKGMGCFISGLYASRYDEAGMLGYVQSGSPEQWQQALKRKINDQRDELDLIPPQQDVEVTSDFPLEWVSQHRRQAVGRTIAIYHILLDCQPLNAPNPS